MITIPEFKNRLETQGAITVIDNVICEAHLDRIIPGSDLDDQWTDININFLRRTHHYTMPGYIMSIAGGTVGLVGNMAREMNGQVDPLHTERDIVSDDVYFEKEVKMLIEDITSLGPQRRIVLLEGYLDKHSDVVSVAEHIAELNPHVNLEVQSTFQQEDVIPELDALGIAYRAIFQERVLAH